MDSATAAALLGAADRILASDIATARQLLHEICDAALFPHH
ncbi:MULTISPECIES: hypothetical protein [unclassified Micromonospora]